MNKVDIVTLKKERSVRFVVPKKGAGVRLKTRLDRLSVTRTEKCEFQIWLYDFDGDTATSPNGERMSHAEADRLSAQTDLVIDLRGNRAV